MALKYLVSISFFAVFLLTPSYVFTKEPKPLYEGFPKMEETQAYRRFIMGPHSDYAILLFLINRFDKADIKINYDGHIYTTVFAAPVARWFLSRHYKNQTPREWISRYCDRSIMTRDPLWVVLPNGSHVRSREVLLNELEMLEHLMATRKAQNPAKVSQGAS